MKETNSVKSLKKQLMAAIAMVCVAAIALGTSTYAWFINNTKVTAESAELTAKTSYALLISKGETGEKTQAADWVSLHSMKNATNTTMVPVSTNGTDSLADGALKFAASNKWSATDALVESYKVPATTDYWTEHFQIKASQACELYLSSDTSFNVDNNANSNLGKTLRLALVVKAQGAADDTAKVFIYEVDETATDVAGNTTSGTADGKTKAIKCVYANTVVGEGITNGADVGTITAENYSSGVATLAASKLTSDGTGIVTNATNIKPIYTFNNAEDVVDVTAYVWMEGCDYDCVSANINKLTEDTNKLKVNLGFCAGQTQN